MTAAPAPRTAAPYERNPGSAGRRPRRRAWTLLLPPLVLGVGTTAVTLASHVQHAADGSGHYALRTPARPFGSHASRGELRTAPPAVVGRPAGPAARTGALPQARLRDGSVAAPAVSLPTAVAPSASALSTGGPLAGSASSPSSAPAPAPSPSPSPTTSPSPSPQPTASPTPTPSTTSLLPLPLPLPSITTPPLP